MEHKYLLLEHKPVASEMALPSHLVSSSSYVVVPLFFSVNFLFIHCVVVVSHVRIRVNNSLSSLSSTTSLIKTSVFTPSLAFLLLCHWFRSSFVQLKTRHCSTKTSLTNKTLNKITWKWVNLSTKSAGKFYIGLLKRKVYGGWGHFIKFVNITSGSSLLS